MEFLFTISNIVQSFERSGALNKEFWDNSPCVIESGKGYFLPNWIQTVHKLLTFEFFLSFIIYLNLC